MDCRLNTSNYVLDGRYHGRPGGYEEGITAGIVTTLCQRGQLSEAVYALGLLVQTDCHASISLFYMLVKECVAKMDLFLGRRVHALAVKKGYMSDTFLCNHILRMYSAHARLQEAVDVFTLVAKPDAYTWAAIISAHVKQGQDKQAIHLYHRMRSSSVKPNCYVFVAALQACAKAAVLKAGQQVHADLLASCVEPDLFVRSSLVGMYAKCGSLEDAHRVFDELPEKDVVTWNAMISGYSQQGMGQEALGLYMAMQAEGMTAPDSVTFVSLLQACASLGAPGLEKGKELHAQIAKQGFQTDVFVACSLLNMYAKCGSLEDAQGVFDGLDHKYLAAWNAMISGYSQQGMGQEALRLYRAMQEEGVVAPNSVTFVCLLQACACVGALHLGRELHTQITEQGLQAHLLVAGSLINMYAKCGSMIDAQQVFEGLPERDGAAWNALIAGYTRLGDSEAVFGLVLRMRAEGIKADGITFLSALTVCSHTGLVSRGREYFEVMRTSHGIEPTADHYACIVDLLGRAGQLDEALGVAKAMPVPPNASVWHTLLAACRKWSNVEIGRHAFDEAVKLDEKDAAAYVLMLNIYTGARMWDQAREMQARRKRNRAWKEPGQTWWTDKDGLVHRFLVGHRNHPRSHGRLDKSFTKSFWKEGFVPHLNGASDDGKESSSCGESGKQDIVHGLNNASESARRVHSVKFLRVCGNSSTATAYISRVVKRISEARCLPLVGGGEIVWLQALKTPLKSVMRLPSVIAFRSSHSRAKSCPLQQPRW